MFIQSKGVRTKGMPFISLFISLAAFKFRLYNRKGYVFFVLTLWNRQGEKWNVWVNPQMDYAGNYRNLRIK